MEARAKLFGHPIHQMLIPIPFGLLATGAVLDIVAQFFDDRAITVVSFWNIAIGVVTGLLAAVFGLMDYTKIPRGTRAKRVGLVHGVGNVIVLGLFTAALYLRADEYRFGVEGLPLWLEIGGLALAGITGWLGGELVDRLAIGVDPDAHPDAPSSLFGRRRHVARVRREPVVEGEEVVTRQSVRTDTPPYGSPTRA
ncbi:DUF2231 domain-containing protein [Sandaracinus amylolyticus]|uniref:DUF2231 domain-containing protein n=1 Tax=Sandaracinus amylolyticus TaxID=927083 RepID=A0A0F6SEI9_9BACT|nr:DUF2231 domain-containing protein [Sandaracinus amylolyticus]AKF05274.1 Hypothetical protein DB32_002423 [Sandaracinus amylolyticus]